MSDVDQGTDLRSDDGLEQLLKRASPRPVPSRQDEDAVRNAVKAEWQSVTGRHRSRQRIFRYAIAATVVLGVFTVFSLFRVPPGTTIQVASIEKSFGAIYLLGEAAELHETSGIANVHAGQTILTGSDSGLALAWGDGGSLRVDEGSRIEFTDDSSVFLQSGRLYFDSAPSALSVGISAGGTLVVNTRHGEVRHHGTQFMAHTNADELVVSVREGQVAIAGKYHDYTASPGEQVTLAGRQRPIVLDIKRSGEAWGWIGRTTPSADVDGKSLRVFLDWASRELGLTLEFEGGAQQVADAAVLRGSIDTQPGEALRLRLASAALSYRIDEGVLYVSD